jgi:hypothetical protein
MKTQAFKNIKLPPTIKGFATDIASEVRKGLTQPYYAARALGKQAFNNIKKSYAKLSPIIKDFAPDIASGIEKAIGQSAYVASALVVFGLIASGALLLAVEVAIPALLAGGAMTALTCTKKEEKTQSKHPKTQRTSQIIALAAAGTALYALGQYAVNDFKTTYERQYKMGALQESFKIAADKEILPLKIQTAKANSYQPEQNRLVM